MATTPIDSNFDWDIPVERVMLLSATVDELETIGPDLILSKPLQLKLTH